MTFFPFITNKPHEICGSEKQKSTAKERRDSSNEYFTRAEENAHDLGFKLGITDEAVRGMALRAEDFVMNRGSVETQIENLREALNYYNAAVASLEGK